MTRVRSSAARNRAGKLAIRNISIVCPICVGQTCTWRSIRSLSRHLAAPFQLGSNYRRRTSRSRSSSDISALLATRRSRSLPVSITFLTKMNSDSKVRTGLQDYFPTVPTWNFGEFFNSIFTHFAHTVDQSLKKDFAQIFLTTNSEPQLISQSLVAYCNVCTGWKEKFVSGYRRLLLKQFRLKNC